MINNKFETGKTESLPRLFKRMEKLDLIVAGLLGEIGILSQMMKFKPTGDQYNHLAKLHGQLARWDAHRMVLAAKISSRVERSGN